METTEKKKLSYQEKVKVNLSSINFVSNIDHKPDHMPINPNLNQKAELQASHLPFMRSKKRNFYHKLKKRNWALRKMKKHLRDEEKPQTPHNTTQFIVNTVCYHTDPYTYDFDNNNSLGDTQAHIMKGSMINLMKRRLSEDHPVGCEGNNQVITNNIEKDINNGMMDKAMMVNDMTEYENNSITSINVKDNKAIMDVNQLLNQAKHSQSGLELQDIIDKLYSVIKEKDAMINDLTLAKKNSI